MKKVRCNRFINGRVQDYGQRGFTLIDTVLVLMLLGLLVMLGLPTLNGTLARMKLSGAAEEIVTALDFARLSALTTGKQTRVTIDAGTETVLVESFKSPDAVLQGGSELTEAEVEGGAFAAEDNPLNKGTDYILALAAEGRFSSVDIVSAVFGGGNFVVFNGVNAPSDGGTVVVSCGSSQLTLTVDSVTGKVTVGSN